MDVVSLHGLNTLVFSRITCKAVSGFIAALVSLAILEDFLQSTYHSAAFYLSESLLFRSVWLLFVPIIYLQKQVLAWYRHGVKFHPLGILFTVMSCVVIHAVAFSILVFILSKTLFDHTYYADGTLFYTLSEDLAKYVLVYGIAGLYYLVGFNQRPFSAPSHPAKIVIGTGQQKTIVQTDDIIFITAASPYIVLHTNEKKYIHAESLRSISQRLSPQQFIRIHKSCIINRQKVISYKSRLNGDYDIRLTNNVDVRLSRNYVPGFKEQFLSSSAHGGKSSGDAIKF